MYDFIVTDLKEVDERRKRELRKIEQMLAVRRDNLRRTQSLLSRFDPFMSDERRGELHHHADELKAGIMGMETEIAMLRNASLIRAADGRA